MPPHSPQRPCVGDGLCGKEAHRGNPRPPYPNGVGQEDNNNMPVSRNRRLTRSEERKRKGSRLYRQVIHRAYVAYLNGAMSHEAYTVFKYFAKRRLLLGDKTAQATV